MTTTTRPQRRCRQPHGTVARYTAGCSCLECCDAWCAYQRERKADTEPRLVDVGPVRAHLKALYSAGMSRRAVAHASGVCYGSLRIIDGTLLDKGRLTSMVRRANAEAILAVTPKPANTTAWIPAAPTKALLEQMVAKGHSLNQITRETGIYVQNIRRQRCMRADHALRVEQAAERLGVRKRNGGSADMALDADALDRLMDAYGYERDAILEAAGVSLDTYQQLRSGRRCSIDMAERIARAVGVPADRLFDIEEAA